MCPNPDTPRRAKTAISGLAREISILRGLIGRINALAEEETTLPELRRVLDSLSSASVRLVNLLQAEKRLHEEGNAHAAALQAALSEMLKRFEQSDE
ncbi:MAG: hypothetical protein RBT34_03500 [Anaerolineaceae bacterium]|nr:hypothetical protein [Anaerolineaceae bacterium]